MQGCCEKAQTLPPQLNGSAMPQMKALELVLEYIFDRNACLLPGYFIANEVQKAYPEGKNWPHWVRPVLQTYKVAMCMVMMTSVDTC